MKISIITVVFNNDEFTRDCIDSVLSQTYKNIEYIVVDGGSTDGTIDIIKSYGNRISKFISEKDAGIYDAMNKGLGLATGEVIGFLNSDDKYSHTKVVADVLDNIGSYDGIYGDLTYVSRNNANKVVRYWKSGHYNPKAFRRGWVPPHPTLFLKKYLYDRFGKFDITFKIAADYELMLRYTQKHNISLNYLPEAIVKMRNGGKSSFNLANRIKGDIECYRAWKTNGLKMSPFMLIIKPLRKILQFF